MKVGFISLGCSKNLVDTEMMIGLLKNEEFEIVNDESQAEILIINTCGFIESAKQEAIDTILEMAKYKEIGNCKYLVATGCLVQRYKKDLEKLLPEVDLFISIDEYDEFWNKIKKLIDNKNEKVETKLDYLNRVITTGNTTAYLKIAEGCSNFCTYCAIPYIRGKYISRKYEDIIKEAEQLAKKGIKEIIIIAQDTTKYGIDLYGKQRLHELIRDISKIENIKWIRFLYAYPESITDELINEVRNNNKVCKYFDIPIQHISNNILKRMNRKTTGENIRNLIKKLRTEIPEVVLRTSLIVGFPGETNEEFEELYNFIKEVQFDKLGVFMYSKEDGTPAAKFTNQVHYKTKQSRWNKIMQEQNIISTNILKKKIGKEYMALIEGISENNKYYIARTYMDVPDMDGVIFIKNKNNFKIGDFVNCKVINVKEYDLIGEVVTIHAI